LKQARANLQYMYQNCFFFFLEPIPESYWREQAEERRLSLAEALAENEMVTIY